MKVLLISANRLNMPYPVYPLGLAYVAGSISAEHTVRVTDMNETAEAELIEILQEFAPDVVGLSLRNVDNTDTTASEAFIEEYRHLAEMVRNHSSALLVLGGSGFTIFPQEIMAALGADYGIIGEGERLQPLLADLERGEYTPDIPGVIAGASREPVYGPWQEDFHRPVSAGLRFDFYLEKGGMLNLQSKRGCPFHCIYCTYPHIEGHRMRRIPPEEVAETAIRLEKAGARYLFMTDSAFNADPVHSLQVARAIHKAGLSIPWGGFFAPTRPPEGYFQAMADAGLTHVEFGTESLSDRVLSAYRKPFRSRDVFAAHRAALDAGLHVAHYFLFGGPGEDRDTLEETLSKVDRLDRTVLFLFCGMRIYPHTALYDIALEEGQISKGQNLLQPVFYQSEAVSEADIIRRVQEKRANRANWLVGSGGEETARIIDRMYRKGFSGPLWEYLIR